MKNRGAPKQAGIQRLRRGFAVNWHAGMQVGRQWPMLFNSVRSC
jgi:hypothetical protein